MIRKVERNVAAARRVAGATVARRFAEIGAAVAVVAVVSAFPWPAAAQDGPEQQAASHEQRHRSGGSVDRWLGVLENPGRDDWQRPDLVIELLELSPGMTVADLGTGTGYFVPHLAAAVGRGGHVLALDVDAELVEHVAERALEAGLDNVEARLIPTDDPELAAGSVDRVLVVNTWHHIGDRAAYAARLARSLAPGGAVFIVDFTMDTPHGPPRGHRLAQEQVVEDLAAGGLSVTVLDAQLERQYVVVGRGGSVN